MINVFLVSDYHLFAAGLEALLRDADCAILLTGKAQSLRADHMPWIESSPEVLLVDIDGDPDGSLAWLRDRPDGAPRMLALSRNHDPELIDGLMASGASGVIDARCSTSAFLKAIEKVAQGEIWLDRIATARVWGRLSRQPAHTNRADDFTLREHQIVETVVAFVGESARSLAARLHMSESTLRNHLTSIYAKCGVINRAGLVAHILKNGQGNTSDGA